LQLNTFAANFTLLRFGVLISIILFSLLARGQQRDTLTGTDSIVVSDTVPVLPDSLVQQRDSLPAQTDSLPPAVIRFDTVLFLHHPFYKFDAPVQLIIPEHKWEGKEIFFYVLAGLVLFFAFIKNAFARYVADLTKLFFRTTIKQRQVKEQLMQAPLPSLLLNILFFLTGAVFVALLLQRYGLGTSFNFWFLLLYCALGLAAIYLVKFITLKLCGWLFRIPEATDAYTFIVFTTNKIIGILLLPLLVLLAFTTGEFKENVLRLSLLLIGAVFLYRFFLSYVSIHRQVKVDLFHFLLYLCAFEIAPLLLINKLLFDFLG
jgi:hypothetical protein